MKHDIGVTIGVDVDDSGFDKGYEDVVKKAKDTGEKSSSVFSKVFSKIGGKLKTTLTSAFSKVAGISKGILKVVTSIIGVIGKIGIGIGAIGLIAGGLIGVILIIAKAWEKVFGENEQLKTDLQYIAFAFGTLLEPAIDAVASVLKKVVEWIIQALKYTMLLINMWAGRNVFANASADKFAKSMATANKNAKKTAKSVQEINKQLAGFDEMNVLSDTSSSGGGSASKGIGTPSFDVSGLNEMETPKWLETVYKIGQWIIDNWQDVVFALLLTKLFIDLLTGNWIGVVIDLIGLIVIAFFKLKDAFGEIIDFIKERWEKLKEWWNAIITVLVEWFKTKWEDLKNWFSTTLQKIGDFFSGLWNGAKTGVSNFINSFKEKFQAVKDWIKTKIIDPIKNFFGSMWDSIKTGASNGLNNVKSTFSNIFNKIIDGINKFIRGLNKIQINIPDWLGGGNFGFNIREIPRLARGGIVNNPGRGVMMGNYIAGENGAEAVLPLTDDTLQRLANMIPITVNLTNTMNGRVISRELQRVQNENDFAYNR